MGNNETTPRSESSCMSFILTVGCFAFGVAWFYGQLHSWLWAIVFSLIGSIAAFGVLYGVLTTFYEQEHREKKASDDQFLDLVGTVSGDSALLIKAQATYLGGHKGFGKISEVDVGLTRTHLVVKEREGQPETRVVVPLAEITDFGLTTKDELTLGRMLFFGILAFALKKKEQYLYVKYKDTLGFENNPVLGQFSGYSIADFNAKLYELIQEVKMKSIQGKPVSG